MDEQKAAFSARMARIQSGGLHTNRTLFVGQDEQIALKPGRAQKTMAKRVKALPVARKARRRLPRGLGLAFMLGVLAFPVALFSSVHPDVAGYLRNAPGGVLGMALALALVMAFPLGLRSPLRLALVACGVFAMAAGFHNIIHAAPDLVAQVFPRGFVDHTLTATQAGTLVTPAEFLTL